MSAEVLDEVLEKINLLDPKEKQQVMTVLSGKEPKCESQETSPHLKWADLVGILPYPAFGEDAQEYITRSRQEDDENRKVR